MISIELAAGDGKLGGKISKLLNLVRSGPSGSETLDAIFQLLAISGFTMLIRFELDQLRDIPANFAHRHQLALMRKFASAGTAVVR